MNHPTRASFLNDVAEHQLTILKDDGVFRHMELSQGSFEHRFEITTWPQHLCISGDMGCYVFSRVQDMFCFFRQSGDDWGVNASYWEEKVLAECKTDGTREFDVKQADQRLEQFLQWFVEGLDPTKEEEAEAISSATNAVKEFTQNRENAEWDVVYRLNNWDEEDAGGMTLDDFWDGWKDRFTYRFIWCCYAIVFAIRQYDEATQSKEAA
ncbi:hypothetical protein Sbal195_1967 [Shewanella baltica OS195]|uniref:Uncharacterized protein n=1 Tax=Shewanella baltica (strain OS195) TaxID=399599 RepID=A9KZN6_SHEB9|nr:hypothetical protein [Shewanella baltica]ABX49138.1 hypothetical protein Sbal195_1967 [Shewanella baltica OS195]